MGNVARQKMTQSLVLEYFDHGDTGEVDASLTENRRAINLERRYQVAN